MRVGVFFLLIFFAYTGYSQSITYGNLQYPPTAFIDSATEVSIYGQVYIPGVTDVNNQPTIEIDAWVGVFDSDTDPSTWPESAWIPANANSGYDFGQNNDEFTAQIGDGLQRGTYYYAMRYSYNGGSYYYGGYSPSGGGAWDSSNVSGVLTIETDALPVKLISFDAIATSQTTLLSWITASEIENKGFSIERSVDGTNWQEIGWVNGAGESAREISYRFIDGNPTSGVNYYRLVQVDFDGQTEYSNVQEVIFNTSTVVIYPNPADEFIELNLPVNSRVNVKILNTTGQIVKMINDYESGKILIAELTKGYYVLEVVMNGKSDSQMFIKQ